MSQFKKSSKKLEKMRGLFFQIGLITACGLTFVAFEWTTSYSIPDIPKREVIAEADWDMPVIVPEEEIVEKPKVKTEEFVTQPNPDKLEIVPDKKEVEDKKDIKKKELKFDPEWKDVEKEEPEDKPIPIPGVMPVLEGGIGQYLSKNLKYPEPAKRIGAKGKVYLQFIVNKKGEVKDVKILHGVNKWLDAEAIRVVKAMPNWKPGLQHGKPVSVIYNLPINFELK